MSEGIAYQNKDVEFKLLSEVYKEKSFAAYGLNMAKIKEVLPTNLPAVEANELRMDNMFLLEDDTCAIVDYESTDKTENRIKYINYIGRVLKRILTQTGKLPYVHLIVIYTGDVERAEAVYSFGCMTLSIDNVFVRDLGTEEIYKKVIHKVEKNIRLTEEELMQLVILPLAEKGDKAKQRRIEQVIDIADQLENHEEQMFLLSGLLVSTDKFITKQSAQAIRRRINMTKVGRMIYEDGMAEGRRDGLAEGLAESKKQMTENMLREQMDISMIEKITGLSRKEIAQIHQNMLISQQ